MDNPFFSIICGVYNRENMIGRCIQSCLDQSFTDFEIVVVDDGSTDNSLKTLQSFNDPRLRIYQHDQNRGISPARYTAVTNSRGKWIVGVDSDWTLYPNCLLRFYEVSQNLPPEIIAIRARHLWEDGSITPSFVPKQPIGYIDRIKWVEVEGGSDALPCYRREIIIKNISPDRRGGLESYYQLNIAQQGLVLYLEDILCKQYKSAANSTTRGNPKTRIQNLKKNAPDMIWMYEKTLEEHGEALRLYGPNQYKNLFRNISVQYFYSGNRLAGTKCLIKYLKMKPFDIPSWFVFPLGWIGPGAMIYGNILHNYISRLRVRFRVSK